MHSGKQISQWVFVADESCGEGGSILALRLQAQPEALDCLNDATDSNCIITLMCDGCTSAIYLWNTCKDCFSEVNLS